MPGWRGTQLSPDTDKRLRGDKLSLVCRQQVDVTAVLPAGESRQVGVTIVHAQVVSTGAMLCETRAGDDNIKPDSG